MGEAKRRQRLIEDLRNPERRADIARVVRSIDFVGDGGTCAMRAATGQKVLALLGMKSRLVFGAMLYRAGPDQCADVVAFCGPDNRAVRLPDQGVVLGHYWLEAGTDLIDFTVGDWQEQAGACEDIQVGIGGPSLPPIQWTTERSEFWWRPRAELTAPWRGVNPLGLRALPPLAVAWYRAEAPGEPMLEELLTGDMMRWVEVLMRDRVAQLLDDWRRGARPEFERKTFVKGERNLDRVPVEHRRRVLDLSTGR